MALRVEHDIFVVRQRGREVAARSAWRTRTRSGSPPRSARSAGSCSRRRAVRTSPSVRRPEAAGRRLTSGRPLRSARRTRRLRPDGTVVRRRGCPAGGRVERGPPRRATVVRMSRRIAGERAGRSPRTASASYGPSWPAARPRHRRSTSWPCRTGSCSPRWTRCRRSATSCAGSTPSSRRPTRECWRSTAELSEELEATNRAWWRSTPSSTSSSAQLRDGERGQEPVPGQRQPRAAGAGHRRSWAWPGCCATRPPTRSPRSSAASWS